MSEVNVVREAFRQVHARASAFRFGNFVPAAHIMNCGKVAFGIIPTNNLPKIHAVFMTTTFDIANRNEFRNIATVQNGLFNRRPFGYEFFSSFNANRRFGVFMEPENCRLGIVPRVRIGPFEFAAVNFACPFFAVFVKFLFDCDIIVNVARIYRVISRFFGLELGYTFPLLNDFVKKLS